MNFGKMTIVYRVSIILAWHSALARILLNAEDPPIGPPRPPPPKPVPKPLDPKLDPIPYTDVFETKLYAQDGAPYQHFGFSLVHTDNLVAVSTDSSGASSSNVYLFKQMNASSYVEYGKVQSANSDDGYGICLALSDQFLLVGAPYDDSDGYLSGRVYVYSLSSSSSKPVEESSTILESSAGYKLGSLYGASVSIYEDTVAVGSPMDSTFQQFSGTVFLYTHNAANRTWYETAKVYDDATGRTFNRFGARVQLLSSSSLAIASTGYQLNDNANVGAVFLYSETSPTQVMEATDSTNMTSSSWTIQSILYPSYTHPDTMFGYMMAFDEEKGVAFIAAYAETRSGMVYVFHRQETGEKDQKQWIVQQILMPTDMDNQRNAFGQSIYLRAFSVTTLTPIDSPNDPPAEVEEQGDEGGNTGEEIIVDDQKMRSLRGGRVGSPLSLLSSNSSSTPSPSVSPSASPSPLPQAVNITYHYLVGVVGAPGDQAMGVESGAIYIYASLQATSRPIPDNPMDPNTSYSVLVEEVEERTWQMLGKVTGNDTETLSSYGHAVGGNAQGSIFVSAILANTPISQQSGAVYVEHSLIPYLITEEYQLSDKDQEGGEKDGDSSHRSWKDYFLQWMTSTGTMVGLACLPAALFIVFVLLQTHKDQIHDYFFERKSTMEGGKYGQVSDDAPSTATSAVDPVSASSSTSASPLEQVLRVLLVKQSAAINDQAQDPSNRESDASFWTRAVHSLRSAWSSMAYGPVKEGERDLMTQSDPSSAMSSVHSDGFLDEPGAHANEEDDEKIASNPLIGSGSSSLPAMAMETEARKRELLNRMHKIVNPGGNPMVASSRRRKRVDSVAVPIEEQDDEERGEDTSAIQV